MEQQLETIEVQTQAVCEYAVIWLHGLGADGADFVPVVPELGLDDGPGVRFVFPDAPAIPVTCNGGYVMRAWYDIISLDSNSRQVDADGIRQSRERIRALIRNEEELGIPAERIFLAGFSQGGALAYTVGLTHPDKLAGIVALSTYLPVPELVAREASAANRATPIFAAHGSEDEIVSLELGLKARTFLLEHGYACEWQEFFMPHAVCIEEIQAIGAWLKGRMAAIGARQ